ncbi:cytochrome b [Tahibacter sp.]|uniref:cytochrome b n=1 Tax=Tahibacter sp. TaxID=2056211 RepID=UPI0028C4CEF8|nr:cytochrome b [Tahibacter sp.]
MALKSEANRWGVGARTLHWIMAVLIIGLGLVGLYMSDLPNSPQKIKIYALHKSVGLTVLALLLLRLAWRLADRRPDELPMPRWQALAARAVHGLLYVLMFALPLSGWLYNSASGYPLQWFSLFNLPSLTGGADPALKGLAHNIHVYGFYVLVLALLAHAGAALKHHFIDRDDTLVRMLPLLRRRPHVPMSREPALTAVGTPAPLDRVPAPPADPSPEIAKP